MRDHGVSRRKFLGRLGGRRGAGIQRARAAAKPGDAKSGRQGRQGRPVPEGLRLGRRDRVVPGRGRRQRGRPRPVGLGHVLPEEGRGLRRATPATIACDHYHRFKDDVALMKTLGVKSYRFSVSWTRVLPNGVGAVNDKGLDFYSRLLDELGKAGITPMCTIFHWDYPEALYKRGGWLNRDSADWFAEYAALLADKFSDRIKLWVTQNEPQCFIGLGHLDGVHAPGDKLKFADYLLAGAQRHARARQGGAGAARARQGSEGDEDRLRAGGADHPAGQRQARGRRGGARGDLRGQRPPPVEQRLVDRPGGARASTPRTASPSTARTCRSSSRPTSTR